MREKLTQIDILALIQAVINQADFFKRAPGREELSLNTYSLRALDLAKLGTRIDSLLDVDSRDNSFTLIRTSDLDELESQLKEKQAPPAPEDAAREVQDNIDDHLADLPDDAARQDTIRKLAARYNVSLQ